MSVTADETAYCVRQIARSTAMARAATDSCVRMSHAGIAAAYSARLTALTGKGNLRIARDIPPSASR